MALMIAMEKSNHISYLDSVRFLAMLMVILCHACDPFNAGATYGSGEVDMNKFFWGSIWGSAVRACVPLFVMLTGILNLPVKWEMTIYWKKRILRVLWPFLIWSSLYYLFPWILGLLGYDGKSVYYFFVWATTSDQSLGVSLDRIMQVPFRFDYIACHMWYIYMLIGLYLFMPILSAWVDRASRRELEYVLCIWAFTTLLPYMHEFGSKYLFGECEWSAFGTFYYFAGYTGYMLIGYYIVKYVPVRVMPTICFSVVAFVAGALVTYFGFRYLNAQPDCTPEQTELFWNYCTPNVAIMSVAVFLLVRLIPVRKVKVARALANFTVCGFGIYLIHYFFVGPYYDLVCAMHTPTCLIVPATAVLVMATSWAVVAVVKHYYHHSRWLLG